FNYKWSYLNEQDRTFSIKNPYWFTRIYSLGTANNFESGVALKIGDGFDGKGGYLTFTGGFLDGNILSFATNNVTSYDYATNGNSNYVNELGIGGKSYNPQVANNRLFQFTTIYATKLSENDKLGLRLSAEWGNTNATTPTFGGSERFLTNGYLANTYSSGSTNIVNTQDSIRLALGLSLGLGGIFDEKAELAYTLRNNLFNFSSSSFDTRYLADVSKKDGNTDRTISNRTLGNASYANAAALRGIDNVSQLKNALLEINTGNRFENTFGYDGRLYLNVNYAKAIFDDSANHRILENVTSLYNTNTSKVTNLSSSKDDSGYTASYDRVQLDLRIRKRISLDVDKKVTFGLYPQYRPSLEYANSSRVRTQTLEVKNDIDNNGSFADAVDTIVKTVYTGAVDSRNEINLSHDFRLPIAVDWKISKEFRLWGGIQARYVVNQKWTTFTEREAGGGAGLGGDVYKREVTTTSGGTTTYNATEDTIKATGNTLYNETYAFTDLYSVGLNWNPIPALEILLTLSASSPWTEA
ncbi:MAG: hypothetical protein JNM63_15630, partial [Spirochaetia bacterium]|nr:hypothetical protein [Spirochaetia bacterium]